MPYSQQNSPQAQPGQLQSQKIKIEVEVAALLDAVLCPDPSIGLHQIAHRLADAGYVQRVNGHWRPTPKGEAL